MSALPSYPKLQQVTEPIKSSFEIFNFPPKERKQVMVKLIEEQLYTNTRKLQQTDLIRQVAGFYDIIFFYRKSQI